MGATMTWVLVLCITVGGQFCGEKVHLEVPTATACRQMLAQYTHDKRVVAYCRPKAVRD
jgi:hypothetical protein